MRSPHASRAGGDPGETASAVQARRTSGRRADRTSSGPLSRARAGAATAGGQPPAAMRPAGAAANRSPAREAPFPSSGGRETGCANRRLSRPRKRGATRTLAERLQPPALSLRACPQRREVDAREPLRERSEISERRPELLLALDAHDQELELREAAQGRVRAQRAVRLEPSRALRGHGEP